MVMNYDKFIYKKMQFDNKKYIGMYWYLIDRDKRNGVHFHGLLYKDKETPIPSYNENKYGFFVGGIECHSKTPRYEGHKPMNNCEVTGGDCYCDGTSLGASERLGHIDPSGKDDGYIWEVLHEYYRSWHENHKETDND